ncbi:MAG TPA: DUF6295 family protein [Acidimicrobiales bacterium]|nr:DUF6295 family protein [Acidimicrobiales bacterium]
MCTMIANTTAVRGVAKGADGWFDVTHACVGYDHATHSPAEHALLLDFMNRGLGPGARVAVELDLASGRALLAELQAAIAAAEATGLE